MRRLLFLMIFGLVGTGILVSLGNWQMRRLVWKEAIIANIEARLTYDPIPVPVDPDPDTQRYIPIQTEAEIEPGELHALASLKGVGAGYLVIVPVTLPDGRRILFERGFVRVEDKNAVRPIGPISITGNLQWPRELFSSTPEPDLDANIWFARDVPAMAKALDTEPILVITRNPTGPTTRALPVAVQGIPNDHWQYAVTWYLLALVWAGMTGYFLWRAPSAGPKKES